MRKVKICLLMTVMITVLLSNSLVGAAEGKYYDTIKNHVGIQQNVEGNQEAQQEELRGNQVSLTLAAPSSILMEASTGKIIYENQSGQRLSPASITKIMTLLLVFENLEAGKIKLGDEVMTSEYAKSMGGSQVFLETGEIQTVDTLIKCIAVSSGNDASVAIAEFIAGSEAEFVKRMNEKAQILGMENTNFEDCCGLTDSANHYTTAEDVAIMSRELITKYPEIFNYTKIWQEDIVHHTAQGSSTFTLSSTNKLLKQYEWATGLKTGSTSVAKYCLSATARKDEIDLVAVVMAAPDFKVRFQDAITLLNYGFSVSRMYSDQNKDILSPQYVKRGIEDTVPIEYEKEFRYLDITGQNMNEVEKVIELEKEAEAPIEKGAVAGIAKYILNGEEIGSVSILYGKSIQRAVYKDYMKKVIFKYLL